MFVDHSILMLFLLASASRLISLFVSVANEKKLKKKNAIEYGKKNSKLLLLCHTLFYFCCVGEALLLKKQVNKVSFFGFGLFIFSMTMLWIVILSLKDIWT